VKGEVVGPMTCEALCAHGAALASSHSMRVAASLGRIEVDIGRLTGPVYSEHKLF
jgi:hypothetical protein